MAVGLAYFLGYKFPQNFNSPYVARSLTEFWRRWHMTLSMFLRDYLYIPLGGNRKGPLRTYLNLMLTMLLGGLWHGASWNFAVWGLLHGLYLAIERAVRNTKHKICLPQPMQILVTFVLVNVAWVFFRAKDLPFAIEYFKLFGRSG
jgi:alginate O-acetyltransferase complex protein AlgI